LSRGKKIQAKRQIKLHRGLRDAMATLADITEIALNCKPQTLIFSQVARRTLVDADAQTIEWKAHGIGYLYGKSEISI
jgi:hypothetical protein